MSLKKKNEEYINRIGSIKQGKHLRIENSEVIIMALLGTGSNNNFLSFKIIRENNILYGSFLKRLG